MKVLNPETSTKKTGGDVEFKKIKENEIYFFDGKELFEDRI